MEDDVIETDVIVVGAGQAGLVAGYFLQQIGLRFHLMDANAELGGSWQHYFRSLRLFSQARYCALPGLRFPGDPDHYPTRDEVIAYLRDYAQYFDLSTLFNRRVDCLTQSGQHLNVSTADGALFQAKAVISASGPFNTPYIPSVLGRDLFRGQLLHAFDYQEPSLYQDQHVVVVGGGESALQIAIELAHVTRVTLATRHPLRFLPQSILGKDIIFWLHETGYDMLPISRGAVNRSPKIIEASPYRRCLASGNPRQRPVFRQFTETGIIWHDGSHEPIDTVIFATGYKPGLGYLQSLNALDKDGNPCHRHGVSLRIPGLYFVGLSGQHSQASATLRGVGHDAHAVVEKIKSYLAQNFGKDFVTRSRQVRFN